MHADGQMCRIERRPEATTINNIELFSFLHFCIDNVDCQTVSICLDALNYDASREQQHRLSKQLLGRKNDL